MSYLRSFFIRHREGQSPTFGVPSPRHDRRLQSPQSICAELDVCVLPVLATAAQIAKPLGLTSRTITAWASSNKLPVALRCGKVLRFYPPAVAAALGLTMSELGMVPQALPSTSNVVPEVP